jgi:hypothetical protein
MATLWLGLPSEMLTWDEAWSGSPLKASASAKARTTTGRNVIKELAPETKRTCHTPWLDGCQPGRSTNAVVEKLNDELLDIKMEINEWQHF